MVLTVIIQVTRTWIISFSLNLMSKQVGIEKHLFLNYLFTSKKPRRKQIDSACGRGQCCGRSVEVRKHRRLAIALEATVYLISVVLEVLCVSVCTGLQVHVVKIRICVKFTHMYIARDLYLRLSIEIECKRSFQARGI